MKKLMSWLGMAVLGIVTAFVLLEIGLRAIGYAEPVWYQPDDELGWTLRPGVRGTYMDEGRSVVRISAAGMRDRLHTEAKPEGTYRIALLGDSYAEAMQVEYRHTFGFLLEDRLARCNFREGRPVEVLNFGVRGYGLPQMVRVLEHRVRAYNPDLVLVVLSSDDGAPESGVRLVRLDPPWQTIFWTAADRLRAVQLLHGQYHRMTEAGLLHASPSAAVGPSGKARSTDALLQRLKATSALYGAELVVALIHPQPAVATFGKRVNIPVIPLAEELRARQQAEGVEYHGFANGTPGRGHWNERGHRAVAEVLADHLCGLAGASEEKIKTKAEKPRGKAG